MSAQNIITVGQACAQAAALDGASRFLNLALDAAMARLLQMGFDFVGPRSQALCTQTADGGLQFITDQVFDNLASQFLIVAGTLVVHSTSAMLGRVEASLQVTGPAHTTDAKTDPTQLGPHVMGMYICQQAEISFSGPVPHKLDVADELLRSQLCQHVEKAVAHAASQDWFALMDEFQRKLDGRMCP